MIDAEAGLYICCDAMAQSGDMDIIYPADGWRACEGLESLIAFCGPMLTKVNSRLNDVDGRIETYGSMDG